MRPPQPFRIRDIRRRERPWMGLVGTTVLYGLIVLAVLVAHRAAATANPAARPEAATSTPSPREVSMVYLTPPDPQNARRPPPAPRKMEGRDQIVPVERADPNPTTDDRDPMLAQEAPVVRPAESSGPGATAGPGTGAEVPVPESKTASRTATERVPGFPSAPETAAPRAAAPGGGSSIGPRLGIAALDPRPWRPSFPSRADSCPELPERPIGPDGKPELGTVVGRVLRLDNGQPLVGARLQIIGTPFGTFSDANGEYQLSFDPTLLDRCRVQYVRITAEGFAPRSAILALGWKVRSDDVILRRN